MSVENLLQRLDNVRKTGADRWAARCPAHDDKGPSLAVRELDDGRVLVYCFAGCGATAILDAVGLGFDALYPPKAITDRIPKVRRPWSPRDALIGLQYESLVLMQYANALATGAVLTDADRTRLRLSATRIQRAQEATL